MPEDNVRNNNNKDMGSMGISVHGNNRRGSSDLFNLKMTYTTHCFTPNCVIDLMDSMTIPITVEEPNKLNKERIIGNFTQNSLPRLESYFSTHPKVFSQKKSEDIWMDLAV